MTDTIPLSAPRFILGGLGNRIAVIDEGPRETGRAPLLCLAGLTRSQRDFDDLRAHFAHHPKTPRRVVSLDTPGRGESDRLSDPKGYSLRGELDDVTSVTTALGLHACVFVGTSRGGILAMATAIARGGLIKGAVLNDVGPQIAMRGLKRLRSQLGTGQPPRDWAEAVHLIKRGIGHQFPAFSETDWERFAHRTFREAPSGGLQGTYDPAILKDLASLPMGEAPIDISAPFRALARNPVMVLRGEFSDLLDDEGATRAREFGAELHTVPGQGHAPNLSGDVLKPVEAFLKRIDAS